MGGGCDHYRRGCLLVAPCCGEAFWCHRCHDEAREVDPKTPHKLRRDAVRELECGGCGERQPLAESCRSCGAAFGSAYACTKCCIFDHEDKQQFHCEGCGICRVGGKSNFFHCDTCGCCLSVSQADNHRCTQGKTKSDCPVCLEYLYDSTEPVSVLRCGHAIHAKCMREMVSSGRNYVCPLCCKSMFDMSGVWRGLDASVERNPMPEEYSETRVEILCNDCGRRSDAPFHVWIKCSACGSYNTRRA